jgi:deoxyribonuclease V
MGVDARRLRSMQHSMAKKIDLVDAPQLSDIKYIGAFAVAYNGNEMAVAGIVMKWPSMEVVETRTAHLDAPMNYIPGLEAFRAGPAIMQLYYEFEYEPQIIFLEGHGIAHLDKSGIANYVGVELDKICIGVAKQVQGAAIEEDGEINIAGERRGLMVATREHANPVAVSPGHKISIETAAEWVKKTIVHPHKRPEPLHMASRLAKKKLKKKEQFS